MQDCAGFWFVYKAHPPVHIRICTRGCNAVDGPKDKQDVQLFLAEALGLVIMIAFQFQPILEVDFPVCDPPAMIIYSAGRETERHNPTNSSMTAVPAHMTVSAPPQYIFTVPSSSGTAPQVKTTLGT